MLDELNRRLEDKQLRCEVTPAAREYLIENGYDPVYGARPLRRYIQKEVETRIARSILQTDLLPNTLLTVDAGADGLTVSHS